MKRISFLLQESSLKKLKMFNNYVMKDIFCIRMNVSEKVITDWTKISNPQYPWSYGANNSP